MGELKVEYCPECGGEMVYDPNLKLYTCKSCGLTLKYHELIELRRKNLPDIDTEEKRKRERKEYLKWWLSKKEG
ncbi:hypothetical protein DRO26_02270 [Candidatus Bathyarchaeota archaeon]|nr:MAG: hypothetical protein DRO26_02270 [Candidatus Bathyarchaeota archaeon]